MKKHTQIYCDYFNIGVEDFIFDEYEIIVNNKEVRAVDINHIVPRGMGGSKTKDYIENLMALSRENHNKFEDGKMPNAKEVHLEFLIRNPY